MSIDPADLAVCLRVLAQADRLPEDHPDSVALRRAASGIYKTARKQRRIAARQRVLSHDDAVTAATATAAPGRIDDETRGIPLVSSAPGASAGTLINPRACYVCKVRYHVVDAFYHQLCPDCAAFNRARRDARTDLSGRRALLTGGRAKIGMYVALRLLRDGAHTTITTRFPRDAARRFASMPDSADWMDRLRIVGIDLRNPARVVELADMVAAEGPLDILVNNACQTVRRSEASYAPLVAAERAELPDGPLPPMIAIGPAGVAEVPAIPAGDGSDHWQPSPDAVTGLALTARSATPERIAAGRAIDAGGLVPDLDAANSWSRHVQDVDPVEMLEVHCAT